MNERRLLDTNVVVRFLLQDDPNLSPIADRLFAACERGEFTGVLMPAVLAECVFVLESFYSQPRATISKESTCSSMNYAGQLVRYGATKLHLIDCMIAAAALAGNCPVATFDSGFLRVSGLQVKVD